MTEADLLLHLLVVAFDAPAQHGMADQADAAVMGGQGGEPELGRLGFADRPLDQEPLLGPWRGRVVVPVSGPYAQRGEAGGERRVRALAPGQWAPGVLGQPGSEVLGRDRLVLGAAPDAGRRPPPAAPGLDRQRRLGWRAEAGRGPGGGDKSPGRGGG